MAKLRAKMPPGQRAKQFAPFDAVVGLRQALKEKEKIRLPRKEISEDMAEEIDRTLKKLVTDDIITSVWYNSIAKTKKERFSYEKENFEFASPRLYAGDGDPGICLPRHGGNRGERRAGHRLLPSR